MPRRHSMRCWRASRPRVGASPRPRCSCPATWARSRTSSTPKAIASACTPSAGSIERTMRRADRLFQLVQLIRGRRLSTADYLAGRLEVSVRTVYRDVADLQAQGVPIEGEAGVGYRMRPDFDLPPLMFSKEEAQALVAAVRIARPRLDAALAQQAEGALSKILAVLPSAPRAGAESLAVFAPPGGPDETSRG